MCLECLNLCEHIVIETAPLTMANTHFLNAKLLIPEDVDSRIGRVFDGTDLLMWLFIFDL